jgi:hypothetical protein
MLDYTARFEAYYGDGDSWGTFEFYEDFSDLLLEAISSGEPFDTGWKGIKKEIASFRIARHASGKFSVMVSCSDDFDTQGYGDETFGVSECGSAEEVLDLIRERLTEAYSAADNDREDAEEYYGFSIYPLFGEHTGHWMHTLILPRNTEAECPPGDSYAEWGFETCDTESLTDEEKEAITDMAWVIAYSENPSDMQVEKKYGRPWKISPWRKESDD